MTQSRLQDFFQAKPRFSNRLPALHLDSVRGSSNPFYIAVYLINNTSETLDFVSSPQPLIFIDSESQVQIDNDCLHYEDVRPGEAIRIAEFDDIFDSDFLHQMNLEWQYQNGQSHSVVLRSKGIRKFYYHVLEWLDDAS